MTREEETGTGRLEEIQKLSWLGTKEEIWRKLGWPSSTAIISALQYEFGWKRTWQPKSKIPFTHIY